MPKVAKRLAQEPHLLAVTLRSDMVRSFLEKHLRASLGGVSLREVTTARLQRHLADLSGHLSPKSLNHLRGYVFNFYSVARKLGGPWEGRPNPVADVERYKVAPKQPRILALDEFEPVLAEVPDEWQGPVAVGLYGGMREGEIFGMLKADVDLQRGVMMVWRSWDEPRTKDGKAMPVPIAAALRSRLERALREAPGRLVFPQADGTMHSRKLRLNRMLRAAIARAGLVDGYEHRVGRPTAGSRRRARPPNRPRPALGATSRHSGRSPSRASFPRARRCTLRRFLFPGP